MITLLVDYLLSLLTFLSNELLLCLQGKKITGFVFVIKVGSATNKRRRAVDACLDHVTWVQRLESLRVTDTSWRLIDKRISSRVYQHPSPTRHIIMSQPPAPAPVSLPRNFATTSSSNIERIFDAALKSYEKKTNNNLKDHDIFKQLEGCDSPAAILSKFQAAQFGDPSQAWGDERLKRWLVPTLNVLCAFSDTLGEGVSLVIVDSLLRK